MRCNIRAVQLRLMAWRLPQSLGALLIATLVCSGAHAQNASASSGAVREPLTAQAASDVAAETQVRVNNAVPVIEKMKADPAVGELLTKARGVVVVPHFVQAALIFGGRGGAGVLLVRQPVRWSDPAFYKLSGGSFGAQIGGTSGTLALLLMSDKAVDAFENKPSTWSLSAGAGLAAKNYSRQTPESESLSDVIVWSDMKGLFGGAAVGATKVTRDVTANQVFYNNRDVTVQEILSGAITSPNAQLLVNVMPLPPAPKQETAPPPKKETVPPPKKAIPPRPSRSPAKAD
jgi:lipid-binding SYLF domain-containing protein